MAWKIPLADVVLGPEEEEAVHEVLASGWLSQGPRVQALETAFAQFLGVRHALAVANGTAALHLACQALGLGPGDEVLCPSFTFVASANAILYTGARPRFVDIGGPHDLNVSVTDAARKITPKTKAIMLVHYAGFAADMSRILALAAQHGLAVIEDCAHAPGARYASLPGEPLVGSGGNLACFSFFANKNLTTGEGGLVATNDDQLAERVRLARSHGMTSLTWDRYRGHSFTYDVIAPGYNYRLDDLRAALGLVQLSRLERANEERRRLTRLYRAAFTDLPPLAVPFAHADLNQAACHIMPILLPDAGVRSRFMEFLGARGIQTSIHYPPVHRFTYYRQLFPDGYDHHLPHTEAVAQREVTLPLYPAMTAQKVEEVCEAVKEFCQQY